MNKKDLHKTCQLNEENLLILSKKSKKNINPKKEYIQYETESNQSKGTDNSLGRESDQNDVQEELKKIGKELEKKEKRH